MASYLDDWKNHIKVYKGNLNHLYFEYIQVSRNIVMEAHLIRPAHFTGITCTAYQRREVSTVGLGMEMTESAHEQQLRFRCSTGSV